MEQIGIAWSDLVPFIESHKQHWSGLADVAYVPRETFSLESLKGVLSYEVWCTCLTDAERKFLIQFLPSKANAEENVHLLFSGKKYHFQNPFLSWSSSLCHGDIHPDNVFNKEKRMKQDEKAYCINLNSYHSNIVDTLKEWKKRFLCCRDTENLFRDNRGNQMQGVKRRKATKGGMPLQNVARSVDVSKLMSYIEIRRTQLNQTKRLKQYGDGIHINQVSRVIGGLDKSQVKPYGALLEAEQRRLHRNWLSMSCNDLPAAFEVLKNRKELMEKSRISLGLEVLKNRKELMEKSRMSLGLELEENVSVLRKAGQLPDIAKELDQPGTSKNGGIPVLQNDEAEYSPQTMLQGSHDQSPSFQDWNEVETKYMATSIDHTSSLNLKDQYLGVKGTGMTNEGEQDFDVKDQDHKGVNCLDEGISCCSSKPDGLSEDLTAIKWCKYGLGVKDEDIKEISCKDTVHNAESHQISSINYTSTHIINTIDRENMQAKDLGGIYYKGPSVDAHEQDQGLEGISHAIVNHNCSNSANISSDMSQIKMNAITVDQEDTNNTMMIPRNSSSLLLKSSEEQMHVEGFLDPNDQVAIGEKDQWRLAGPLQSHYHPPENTAYNGSDDLQIPQQYHSSGQQSSSLYLDNGVLSQQQPQLSTSVFSVGNPASLIEPFSKLQNDRLQMVNDVGAASYPLQHANSIKQSTSLYTLASNCLAQSAPFPRPLLEQQLADCEDGIYEKLHEDYYAGGNGLTHQLHNSNSGSSIDGSGTMFSSISQYKKPSEAYSGYHGSSPRQLLEARQVGLPQNFLPKTQDLNPPFPDMFGDTHNMGSTGSSHVASDVGSLEQDNMHWTNFTEENPGMPPDFTTGCFQGHG